MKVNIDTKVTVIGVFFANFKQVYSSILMCTVIKNQNTQ